MGPTTACFNIFPADLLPWLKDCLTSTSLYVKTNTAHKSLHLLFERNYPESPAVMPGLRCSVPPSLFVWIPTRAASSRLWDKIRGRRWARAAETVALFGIGISTKRGFTRNWLWRLLDPSRKVSQLKPVLTEEKSYSSPQLFLKGSVLMHQSDCALGKGK